MSIKGFHLCLSRDTCPRVFYILILNSLTGWNLIPLISHLNLTLITITAIYSHFTLFTLILLDWTHDCNATNDNKTTFRYELCILIKPQSYIIILEQLSTTWIIDIMTTLYHISQGGRGPLLFKLILVISFKTPPFPVIVINTISSLVLFNPPYKAYLITPHAGLFPSDYIQLSTVFHIAPCESFID